VVKHFLSLPLIIILIGLGAVSMILPALHAAVLRDWETARTFFQAGVMFLILTAMLALATSNRVIKRRSRSYLLGLLAAFTILPLMLAVPFIRAVPDTSFLNAYVEMVSDFSTTGATLFDDPGSLPPSVHLWRALVGWMGGFLMLVAAVAILAPMNLGGYEVLSSDQTGRGATAGGQAAWAQDGSERLRRFTVQILPIYTGVTLVLWIVLLVLGDMPLVAISHAMSVMSTSGISPIGGLNNAASGWGGEAAILLALVFAISRQAYSSDQTSVGLFRLNSDPEFRLALFLVITVTALLFLRHWAGALGEDSVGDLTSAAGALWGSLFTVTSFLTTTGFESADWLAARGWSGLATPGLILMGLALIGGGVATTAGGVKLLRIYALYKHGTREMARLVYPSSVGGAGTVARRLRRRGATFAWVFFMLFALTLALTISLFTLSGLDFETATILAVAGLSTTGPLVGIAGPEPINIGDLSRFVKLIFAATMVLGRLETLAIIALLNPEFWRK